VADLLAVLLGVGKVGGASLGGWIYDHIFASWASPINASLAMGICFVLVCLGLMWILYRKQIFLKI
jgi:predicted acyltransferase